MTKGSYVVDSHWGYERVGGHLKALHDPRAHDIALQIISDWKPDVLIHGGDGLDCGVVSHWNRGKPRLKEGLRLQKDAADFRHEFLEPARALTKEAHYILGNHEDWLEDFVDEHPELEGLIGIETLLGLNRWNVVPQGGWVTIGRLNFLHGDTVKSSTYPAKWAVDYYGRSVVFGHFHSPQLYTRHTALDVKDVHQGRAVGCLCRRDPRYGQGQPNRWAQSFVLWEADKEQFQVHEVNIFDGRAIWQGRTYRA